jgi:hypothetical protein
MRRSRWLASVSLLVACHSLPSETEKVDLTPGGLPASLEAPRGATVHPRVSENAVEVRWGDLDGTLQVDPTRATTPPLACPASDGDCKVVESDPTSLLYTTKYQTRTKHFVLVDRSLGGARFRCSGVARDLGNARQLLAACKTLTGPGPTGPTVSAAAATTLTSAAMVTLEELSLKEKTPAGEVKLTVRAPRGWESQAMGGGGRMFLDPTARSAPADAVTIRISPCSAVKTLAQAEDELRRADSAGLDTIEGRKTLSPKTFQLSTAPRGKGQIMTVNVFATGKTRAMWAQCYGPAKRRATLEDVCASLKVE